MALDKAELQPSSSWFLIARNGDVRLRLQREICIGEDTTGSLVLDPEPLDGLIECSVVSGLLTLRCVQTDISLCSKDGMRQQALQIEQGSSLSLALPHNTIRLTGDTTSGRDKVVQIRLVTAASAQPLSAPRRSTPDAVATQAAVIQPSHAADRASAIPTLTQQLPHQLPNHSESAERLTELDLLAPILVNEALPTLARLPQQPRREIQLDLPASNSSGGSALALILFSILALGIASSEQPQDAPATDKWVEAAATRVAAKSLVLIASNASRLIPETAAMPARPDIAESDAVLTSTSAKVEVAAEAVVEQTSPQAADSVAAEVSGRSDEQQRALNRVLDRAGRLLNRGDIIAPATENAVAVLKRALAEDPGNARALTLMNDCADKVLEQARQAERAGNAFEARNLVEEVLAFQPAHPDANRLWAALTAPAAE